MSDRTEEKFKCKTCHKECKSKSEQVRCQTKHGIKAGSKSGHVCAICNHVASRKEHLQKHFNTKKHKEAELKKNIVYVSNQIGEIPVRMDETVDEIDNLSQATFVERKAVNGLSSITFECPRCGQKFNSNDEINEHDEYCIITNGIAIDKEMIPIIVNRFIVEVAAALIKHIENSCEIEWLQPQ